MFMKAEELPAYTLDPVSVRRRPYLLADDNPQPVKLLLIFFHEQDEIFRMKLPSCLHYPFKVLRIGYPFLSRESERPFGINHLQEFYRLNTEFLSTLHSPSLQNVPASSRTHPLQKTMRSFSSYITRLICPFHGFPLRWINVFN